MEKTVTVPLSWIREATRIANKEGRHGRRATVQILMPTDATGNVAFLICHEKMDLNVSDPD